MTTLAEGSLRFVFDDRWTVVRYDGDDPGDYKTKMRPLEDTKAVDFVALQKVSDKVRHVYWIEVKDYRTQPRPSQIELGKIVAQKTRDSLAGVMGFFRTSSTPDVWRPLARAMAQDRSEIKVLFWLEERPKPGPPQRRANREQVQVSQIKKRLRWLTTKVMVVSQGMGGVPDGLTVSDIPPA